LTNADFSIDYGIVIAGELELELDGGEIVPFAAVVPGMHRPASYLQETARSRRYKMVALSHSPPDHVKLSGG